MTTSAIENNVAFKNILVATDFSDASRHAVESAATLISTPNQRLSLLHVIHPETHLPVPLDPLPPGVDPAFTTARHNLDALISSESLDRLNHEELLRRGPLWNVVSDVIREKDIDLLVLGTRGRTGLRKLVLGSVAEELFRCASCPVLTVGPAAAPIRPIRRVLYVTDFGPASLHALPYAIDFANRNGGELILLHLVSPMPVEYIGPFWYPGTDVVEREAASQGEAMERLRELLPSSQGLKCSVEHVVEVHLAPEGLVSFARERNVDLIVMGLRESAIGAARIASHMPWAIAHEVVSHAECPVLTVRG
jgi:nucleotide-binding universal stress UspA family protein